jgi:hypothetical protein
MSKEEEKLKTELRDTIALSNSIIEFHDEVMELKTLKIEYLESENRKLQALVLEASRILRTALLNSTHEVIN